MKQFMPMSKGNSHGIKFMCINDKCIHKNKATYRKYSIDKGYICSTCDGDLVRYSTQLEKKQLTKAKRDYEKINSISSISS